MQTNSLGLDPKEFEALLHQSTDLVLHQHADQDDKKAYHHFPQKEIEAWFDEPLP